MLYLVYDEINLRFSNSYNLKSLIGMSRYISNTVTQYKSLNKYSISVM